MLSTSKIHLFVFNRFFHFFMWSKTRRKHLDNSSKFSRANIFHIFIIFIILLWMVWRIILIILSFTFSLNLVILYYFLMIKSRNNIFLFVRNWFIDHLITLKLMIWRAHRICLWNRHNSIEILLIIQQFSRSSHFLAPNFLPLKYLNNKIDNIIDSFLIPITIMFSSNITNLSISMLDCIVYFLTMA